jgi:hypothetical protein
MWLWRRSFHPECLAVRNVNFVWWISAFAHANRAVLAFLDQMNYSLGHILKSVNRIIRYWPSLLLFQSQGRTEHRDVRSGNMAVEVGFDSGMFESRTCYRRFLVVRILKVLGSNPEIRYSDSRFSLFSSALPDKFRGITQIRSWQLPPTSFPIHYSLQMLSSRSVLNTSVPWQNITI